MAKYLLDATVLVRQFRGHSPTTQTLQTLVERGNTLGVCAVALGEFFSGLGPIDRLRAEVLISSLEYVPTTRTAAEEAGRFRFDFAQQGITLSMTDTLIAATAIDAGATLITANVRHFPQEGLKILQQP